MFSIMPLKEHIKIYSGKEMVDKNMLLVFLELSCFLNFIVLGSINSMED